MKHFLTSSIILSAAAIMAGCNSGNKIITTTPDNLTVAASRKGEVNLNVDFNLPAHTVASRSRLFITPAFMVGDTIVKEYAPLVIDGRIYDKKLLRDAVLHGKVDPYALTAIHVLNHSLPMSVNLSETLQLPAGFKEGRLVAVTSKDGCGMCTGIDTLLLANIDFPRFELPNARKSYMKPEFKVVPKVHQGNGEARLQFIVNKWDIVPGLANNKAELQRILDDLGPILSDSLATVTSLNIFGSASAEASYNHNVMLATNRANSAKMWLMANLNIPAALGKKIKVGARPEGWEPVVQAMIAANDPDSIKVRELMIKYPGPTDDAAEKYIRCLPCWKRIRDNYLAKDRKVLYDYTWSIKNFTNDEEMIEMYKVRPDALSESEFLHVADLAVNNDDRLLVYRDLLKFYPDCLAAINNMAAIYLENEQPAKAVELLRGINTDSPEILNNLAIAYAALEDEDKAVEILQRLSTEDAKFNLELLEPSHNN